MSEVLPGHQIPEISMIVRGLIGILTFIKGDLSIFIQDREKRKRNGQVKRIYTMREFLLKSINMCL